MSRRIFIDTVKYYNPKIIPTFRGRHPNKDFQLTFIDWQALEDVTHLGFIPTVNTNTNSSCCN